MAKPPPTRIKSKAPVSLAPVKALGAGAERKASVATAPKADVKPDVTPAAKPGPKRKPPVASPAAPKAAARPAAAKAVAPAPAIAAAAPPARLPKAAKPAASASKPVKPAPAAKAPARRLAATASVAAAVPPLAAPKRVDPLEAAAPAAAAERSDIAAASKPQAAAAKPEAAPASPGPSPARPQPKPAAPEAKPTLLGELPPPRLPEVASLTSEAVMSQAMTMARAFGAVQATLLDHACTQLEATMEDAEKLARSDSASEAIALQAKAVRRSFESYAEHLKELARIASGALKKD